MYMLNPLIGKRNMPMKGMNMDMVKLRDPTDEFIILEDSQHAAFLKMLGWKVVPWIEVDVQNANQDPNSKRVEFQVHGDPDAIKKDMEKYYDNQSFPIQEFCRHLKDIKSAMYNMRRLKK